MNKKCFKQFITLQSFFILPCKGIEAWACEKILCEKGERNTVTYSAAISACEKGGGEGAIERDTITYNAAIMNMGRRVVEGTGSPGRD